MDIGTVLTYLKQLFSTILTLLMMMSPVFGGDGATYAPEKPEEAVVSFAVVSDIHVETNNPESYDAYYGLLEGIKAGEDVDAVVYTGDNVMNGQLLENIFFYTAIRAVKPSENNFVVAGNHDYGNGEGDFNKFCANFLINNALFLETNLVKPYYYRVVDGIYMIFLSSEGSSVNECIMSDEQYVWLEDVLGEAKEADAPVFVFNHHPVNYISDEDSSRLADILGKYENLLYIHGHIHNKLNQSSFYEWNGIRSINLPRSTEIVDYEPGDGIFVEVYDDEILVRGRNFIDGEWIDGLEFRYPVSK